MITRHAVAQASALLADRAGHEHVIAYLKDDGMQVIEMAMEWRDEASRFCRLNYWGSTRGAMIVDRR